MGECCVRSCPWLCALWDRCFHTQGDAEKVEHRSDHKQEKGDMDRCLPSSCPEEGAVFTALWAFKAGADEELSFQPGDQFRIAQRSGAWWLANKIDHTGRVLATGFVPFNYLEKTRDTMDAQPWFFGKMNRCESLTHLMSPENQDGAFLVRISETDMGHVISVKVKNRVKHYKVYHTESGFCIDRARCFPSLLKLVEHYQAYPLVSVERLGKPCIRREPTPQDLSHITVDEWELPKEDFTLGELLGSGNFADVHRGKWKNHINVAIKILKDNASLDQHEFQMEVKVLKKLRHRHLISLFAICTSSTPYYIITELMEKGNLLNLLRSKKSGGESLDLEILIDMASQVADGMAYLENQKSIHRDLAARNVLVGDGYICKVADFGLARFIKEPFYVSEDKKIPYRWTAPEAISHGRFSNKSDVWSFGILLYEIVTYGAIPYPGFNTNEVVRQITECDYRMPQPPKCPRSLYSIMRSCWSKEPEDRPDFKQLKSDLKKVDRCSELV